jgi:hypothetical protein
MGGSPRALLLAQARRFTRLAAVCAAVATAAAAMVYPVGWLVPWGSSGGVRWLTVAGMALTFVCCSVAAVLFGLTGRRLRQLAGR